MRVSIAALVLSSLAMLRGSALGSPTIKLDERAEAAGLGGVRVHGANVQNAGVAFVDLDGDAWPDLYFGGEKGKSDTLCINQRTGAFSCAPVAGVPPNVEDVFAIAAGDYDADGDLDLYVMRFAHNLLYRNEGGGRFVDVTAMLHAEGFPDYITTSGTFFDYDGDGRLDLYVGHWNILEFSGTATRDQILRQTEAGTFEDVTGATGVNDHDRATLAMAAFDYDGDGKQDLYVSSDFDQAMLFHNDGGSYSDVTAKQKNGFAVAVNEGMGIDAADLDGDGLVDFYVSGNRSSAGAVGSALFLNQGGGVFATKTSEFHVEAEFGWGTGLIDFDNDTWPDIFVATDVLGSHFLYHNRAGKVFEEQLVPSTKRGSTDCVTAAFADYDHDGRVDLVLFRADGSTPQLFHNVTEDAGHWLRILLVTGRDELGAKVRVTAGARTQERELLSQTSKGSQNDRWFTFGLGDATTATVQVVYPDGHVLDLPPVTADRELVLDKKGESPLIVLPPAATGCALGGKPTGSMSVLALLVLFYLGAHFRRIRRHLRPNLRASTR